MTPERPRVVLASASPRRRDLLTLIGIPHEVRPADVDESLRDGESPAAYVERLAREKAQALGDGDAVAIGSDTTVVVDGEVLAKPESEADAARMLRRLSGRSHTVLTGVAVTWRGRVESGVESVGVTFRDLSAADIAAYIATGEPMDKAGAYGIQGYGATIVTRVDGDYFAVMGLAVNRMVRLFERLGLRYPFGPLEVARR
ncbi:MAG: septum formation inhibitor Maf [Gemmatimonadota bacterium]|nr:septum formation inhibitor Maf [Gemmatimonadota bacterium]MDE3172477.1 septum formation inhibitor Maf [Gemmatimonadota bacterium]MDE3215838.1 septum formation inhibitor Maf [Gemmatimonadota bacterium]